MTLDWAAILNSGFLLFFAVAVMRAIGKYGPDFLKAWNAFTLAIHDLTTNVADNTSVTRQQVAEQMSFKELIIILNDKLNSRDSQFERFTREHGEIMAALRELKTALDNLKEE